MGLELGLLQHTLNAIKLSHRDIVDECFREMLNETLLSSPNLQWSRVISALRQKHIGFFTLANRLAKSHDPKSVTTIAPTMSHILLDEVDQVQPMNPQATNCNGNGEQMIFFLYYGLLMLYIGYRC